MVRIGSFAMWVWLRTAEAVTGLGTFLHYFASGVAKPEPLDLLVWFLLASGFLYLHPIAYGQVDNNGLHFRQYLQMKFVPWAQIYDVHWKRWSFSTITVTTRHGIFSRRIEFYENPSIRDAWDQLSGKQQPESVAWIQRHIEV